MCWSTQILSKILVRQPSVDPGVLMVLNEMNTQARHDPALVVIYKLS